jgi:hypothetical protein
LKEPAAVEEMKKLLYLFAALVLFQIQASAQQAGEKQVLWAADKAGRINKLNLLSQVETRYVDDYDELISLMKEYYEEEYPNNRYKTLSMLSEKLGFYISKEIDDDEYLTLSAEGIAGFYDHEKKAIYVLTSNLIETVQKKQDQRLLDECGYKAKMYSGYRYETIEDWHKRNRADLTLVHEMTHALQDQHFDLESWFNQYESNTDAALAIRSVVEGFAEYTEEYFLSQLMSNSEPFVNEIYRYYNIMLYEILEYGREWEMKNDTYDPEDVCGDFVSYRYQLSSFPYTYGLAFMQRLHLESGWRGWDKLHNAHYDHPLSTEQVIHPEKYFDKKKLDFPVFIVPPDLTPLLPESFEFLDSDSLGEFRIYIMLKDLMFSSEDAIRISEGWGGDRYIAFMDNNEKDIAFAWLTVWDSEKDADEFFSFFIENIIHRKQISVKTVLKNKDYSVFLSFRDYSIIKKNGNMVLILEGFKDKNLAESLIDKLMNAETYKAEYEDYEVVPDYYKSEEKTAQN